jgi:hypothetical protein
MLTIAEAAHERQAQIRREVQSINDQRKIRRGARCATAPNPLKVILKYLATALRHEGASFR